MYYGECVINISPELRQTLQHESPPDEMLRKGDLVGCDISSHLQSHNPSNGQLGGTGGTGGGNTSDIIVKSSSDVKALTYCDLKCIHIGGLVEVLRLYPEYQQEFLNDIQHDLTYNLREGYEAEVYLTEYECNSPTGDSVVPNITTTLTSSHIDQESEGNGLPSLTLPSISEDDENAPDEHAALSPAKKSPLHQASSSPRHAKFSSRVEELRSRARSGSTTANVVSHRELRERVERQRSVVVPLPPRDDSLEGLNLEVHNTRSSVERLDTQVSSLHHDVAALSMEVRNAIHALQEMTTPMHWHAAHSNPNLQWTHGITSSIGAPLARSSSHPPEMFCWVDEHTGIQETRHRSTRATQTDNEELYLLPAITQYISENPSTVMLLLGIDPVEFTGLHDDHRRELCSVIDIDNDLKPLSTIQETSSVQASSEDVSSSFTPTQRLSLEKLEKTDNDTKKKANDFKREITRDKRSSSFKRHRFSAGDLDSESEKLLPDKSTIPATRSLKFHPSES